MVTAEMGVLSASSDLFRVLLPRANRAVQTLLDYWAYTLSPPCSIVLEDPNTDYSPSRPHRPRVRFDEQQVLTQVLIMHRFGDYAARTVHQHEALLSTQCSTMSRFTVKWIACQLTQLDRLLQREFVESRPVSIRVRCLHSV